MYSFDLPLATLRAVRTHCAENDIRDYLNGIRFDTKQGVIVGTDGHRAIVCKMPVIPDTEPFTIRYSDIDTVSAAWAAAGYKIGSHLGDHAINITIQQITHQESGVTVKEPTKALFKMPNGEFAATEIGGSYPDIFRVIPDKVSGELTHFNTSYISDATKALAILRNLTPRNAKMPINSAFIAHNGTSAGVVRAYDLTDNPVIILIMPMRLNAEHDVKGRLADINDTLASFKPKQVKAA